MKKIEEFPFINEEDSFNEIVIVEIVDFILIVRDVRLSVLQAVEIREVSETLQRHTRGNQVLYRERLLFGGELVHPIESFIAERGLSDVLKSCKIRC